VNERLKRILRDPAVVAEILLKERRKKYGDAHKAVMNALNSGELKRPAHCEKCGAAERQIDAHHFSYLPEHHLDMQWL
jgi:hypothetical protein